MLTKAIRCTLLVAVLISAGASVPYAQGTSVRSVRVAPQGATTAVTIEADGPLPKPRVGVLVGPPRIYLDFPGVKPATSGTFPDVNAPVHGVRVALNQEQPLVTRVVLDLAMPMPHRIDASMRERGQLIVLVGPATAATDAGAAATPPTDKQSPDPKPAAGANPAQPPANDAMQAPPAAPPPVSPATAVVPPKAAGATPPAQPTAAAPAAGVSATTPPPPAQAAPSRADVLSAFASDARTATERPSAKDVEKYLQKAAAAIIRLERVRPFLVALDGLASVPDDQLRKVADEFEAIRRALAAIEPPRKLEATHELLSKACVLGANAARARVDRSTDEPTRAAAAASAAAGALMLLERAHADLGLTSRIGS